MARRRVVAIDPGNTESAWVFLEQEDGERLPEIVEFGKGDNLEVMRTLYDLSRHKPHYVFEQVKSYGMAVGEEVFETVFWTGRFFESVNGTASRLPRMTVKMTLCYSAKANDSNIRQALIDRWGGKEATKKGGPLHGISKDVWAALALGVTYLEKNR